MRSGRRKFEQFFPKDKFAAIDLPWIVAPPAKEELKKFIRKLRAEAAREAVRKVREAVESGWWEEAKEQHPFIGDVIAAARAAEESVKKSYE